MAGVARLQRRSLGDKLQQLALLSPNELTAIERLVDYRLAQHLRASREEILRTARPWLLIKNREEA